MEFKRVNCLKKTTHFLKNRLWPVFSLEQFPNDSYGIALGRQFYKKLGNLPLLMDQKGVQKSIRDGYFLLPEDSPSPSPSVSNPPLSPSLSASPSIASPLHDEVEEKEEPLERKKKILVEPLQVEAKPETKTIPPSNYNSPSIPSSSGYIPVSSSNNNNENTTITTTSTTTTSSQLVTQPGILFDIYLIVFV